ncbi:MAG: toprim domain-containing protein [Candidatus Bathyarchaeota archaeon]|nr:toprim domain-containing protein [Candidatus Bathyarchaeota archaeon]
MSAKDQKRLEKLVKLLERLKQQAEKGTPIVVEGKNDVKALNKLGITGDMISAKTAGKSFLDVVSEIENRELPEVILLLDFDRRGQEYTKRLIKSLECTKISSNLLFWRTLFGLIAKDVKDIEGLANFFERLNNKCLSRKV